MLLVMMVVNKLNQLMPGGATEVSTPYSLSPRVVGSTCSNEHSDPSAVII